METYTLTRVNKNKNPTEGFLMVGETQFYSLERPWVDNKPFVSCIPADTYLVLPDSTGKHQYYRVQDVPGRTDIEIHAASLPEQLEGCIALGFGFAGRYLVKSKRACDHFKELVGDNAFYLEIIDA